MSCHDVDWMSAISVKSPVVARRLKLRLREWARLIAKIERGETHIELALSEEEPTQPGFIPDMRQ